LGGRFFPVTGCFFCGEATPKGGGGHFFFGPSGRFSPGKKLWNYPGPGTRLFGFAGPGGGGIGGWGNQTDRASTLGAGPQKNPPVWFDLFFFLPVWKGGGGGGPGGPPPPAVWGKGRGAGPNKTRAGRRAPVSGAEKKTFWWRAFNPGLLGCLNLKFLFSAPVHPTRDNNPAAGEGGGPTRPFPGARKKETGRGKRKGAGRTRKGRERRGGGGRGGGWGGGGGGGGGKKGGRKKKEKRPRPKKGGGGGGRGENGRREENRQTGGGPDSCFFGGTGGGGPGGVFFGGGYGLRPQTPKSQTAPGGGGATFFPLRGHPPSFFVKNWGV